MAIDPEALCVELDCCPQGFGVDDIVVSEAVLVETGNCSSTSACTTVTGINVTNSGTGYSSAPSVTIGPPQLIGGTQAVAIVPTTVTITTPIIGFVGGKVLFVQIIDPGSGYTSVPSVSFSGGTPLTPATGIATIYLTGDSLTNLQVEDYSSILS